MELYSDKVAAESSSNIVRTQKTAGYAQTAVLSLNSIKLPADDRWQSLMKHKLYLESKILSITNLLKY